ncbi:uncharacterized protein LOC116131037 [Pistacia vera]|uniref:uncharacterized protein LOC116131037 n=1 Tax=Pistacia vera TaxID=55513 RepID=UPI0012634283|nr:uncharacterized protein LOC116131037 [Pistacia vera]
MGQVKTYGICSNVGHPTDMCPTLQEPNSEQANAMGGYQGQKRQRYDPFSNTYNSGWMDHPNLSYGGNQQAAIPNNPPGFPYLRAPQPYQARPQNVSQGKSFEDLVNSLATSSLQFQQENLKFQQEVKMAIQDTKMSIKNLESQVSQLATTVGRLEAQGSRKLPSQSLVNPRENVSAITLRSGRQLEGTHKKPNDEKEVGDELIQGGKKQRFATSTKEEHEQEILETFRKVHVNIPLLDAIKQVSCYAKFLKELCTSKRKLKGNEVVSVGENVSIVLQRKLPPKCKDPGSFTIPFIMSSISFEKAMLDLGASINVMPYSIYLDLNLGALKETNIVIQLADRSKAYPKGVLEDVLVQVNELIFPVDFYVLEMKDVTTMKTMPLLLGRPFMKTACTKIDVYNGTLTMEFDGEII